MKICLDAGHYGKYNPSPVVKGYYESEMAWKLHLLLKTELEGYGCEIVTTRADQAKDMAVYDRGKAAKGCDLLISLHSNATADGALSTDYPLACCQISGVADGLGLSLAETAAKIMGTKQAGRIVKRRGKNGDWYGVLRGAASVGVPAILLEHSFHTNPTAAAWLTDANNLRRLAEAEAETIAKHYGLTKTAAVPSQILYRVQIGAFANRANAEAMVQKAKAAGFEAVIIAG